MHQDKAPSEHINVLAIASRGNCWVELQNIVAAFEDAQIFFARSSASHERIKADTSITHVDNFTLYTMWKMPRTLVQVIMLLWKTKPKRVVSTGGAPGVLAIILGRIMGAHCIWVDSLYNSQEISLSGKIAGLFAQTWLTQWEHLSQENGPLYKGALL
ncbi:MAG TPA: glucuronosyltransferase [Devosia sp.]|nr:glucuronosyltransferase [Devosia sp.]